MATPAHAEQFAHGADIGVRGCGATEAEAFEQAAMALSAIVTDPSEIDLKEAVDFECNAADDALLLTDWLNRLIYEMAVRHMLFGRYSVAIENGRLHARAWGEPIDRDRHAPAVEPKGATFTELKVERRADGSWLAQCVVDV